MRSVASPAVSSVPTRRGTLAGAGAFVVAPALALSGAPAASPGAPTPMTAPAADGRHDFAFQTGNWSVRHRKLKARLQASTDWLEFDGTCRAWELMDGAGNIDDHLIGDAATGYRAATLRTLDRKTGVWTIYWADQRLTELARPLQGRFKQGVGTFFGEDELDGRPILVRFIWSEIGPEAARWEQAFSPDKGATWEVNWVMRFARVAAA